ncbi:carbon-nitrogen hydrolase family protein [Biformimicrobium ophioploci]|uniref:Carbon-nitrogen hydrolase n=1 Tax=Biformimicrobium ophioploci TaxID=3036711 RepID=A0ABQ6LXU9_9GAMM|nr:carbon-nitrogen hydrolase family protein [Microbulbifer sp. NKW57]GMG86847.1 carbon-nitrogen hydrolase [Microbulbifer sp. NKW57]
MLKTLLSWSLKLALVAIAITWFPYTAEPPRWQTPRLEALNSASSGPANLLSVQPYLVPGDYVTPQNLYTRLQGYLQAARREGWLTAQTIAVFPEHIGTWLVAAGGGVYANHAPSTTLAMPPIILKHPLRFAKYLLAADEQDPLAAAVFRSRAGEMAALYQSTFQTLAREFGITIVGGSIALPAPRIQSGSIVVGEGPIFNSSFLFFADGRIAGPSLKQFPITSELPFTAAAAGPVPVYQTPAGLLSVLICADSWYPQVWEEVRRSGAELVAVPSFSAPDNLWRQPWQGYNGAAAPADVNPAHVGTLTEGEAWLKYAFAGRSAGIHAGMNTFLRGDLWDLGDDGITTAVLNGRVVQGQPHDGPVLSSLWFDPRGGR